ncbi:hypothetical protein J6590_093066, partial [Homalodisca vitripennis]
IELSGRRKLTASGAHCRGRYRNIELHVTARRLLLVSWPRPYESGLCRPGTTLISNDPS